MLPLPQQPVHLECVAKSCLGRMPLFVEALKILKCGPEVASVRVWEECG